MSLPRWLLTALTGLALLTAALAPPSSAFAAGDVYTVSDVPVDVSAGSASQAREQALERGHREAFERLLGRIVPAGEREAVPEMSYDGIANLVRDFQVSDERTSNVRYLADLTIRFRPEAVRRFLRDNGIAYAETVSKPVVVLPVFGEAESAVLWDDPNPWREVWNRRESEPGLVPLTVPLGDLGDIQAISATEALQGDQEAVAAIAGRAGAGDAVVAHLTLEGDPEAGDAAARVVATRVGLSGPQHTTIQTVRQASAKTLEEVLERAADAVAEDMEAAWRQANLVRFEDPHEVSVIVPLRGLDDWTKVRQRLSEVAVVGETALRRMSRAEAELDMTYYGDPEQLKRALRQSSLHLETSPEQAEEGQTEEDEQEQEQEAWRLRPSEALIEPPAVPMGEGGGQPEPEGAPGSGSEPAWDSEANGDGELRQ